MFLNQFEAKNGATSRRHKPKRVGRGIGCGLGKTAGRGHKGQKSRAGGGVKPGFEGGQMPLYRRIPKFGFKSRVGFTTKSLPISILNQFKSADVTFEKLKSEGLVNHTIKRVRFYLSGSLSGSYHIKSEKEGQIVLSKGALTALKDQGGSFVV